MFSDNPASASPPLMPSSLPRRRRGGPCSSSALVRVLLLNTVTFEYYAASSGAYNRPHTPRHPRHSSIRARLDARRPDAATMARNPEELGSGKCSERCPNPITNDPRRIVMNLTAEQREQVATELRRFAGDLKLTDDQKEKLHTALAEGREKVAEYLKNNPNTTRADIIAKVKAHRDEIRQRVVKFLTPEQLSKWDAEAAKAREFLGQKLDS